MPTITARPRRIAIAGRRQRGIAAIEFALVFMLLFIAMYGVVTFGAIFYTQQAISRAAEDGARAAMMLPQPPDQGSVCQVVAASLARSLVVPTSICTNTAGGLISVLVAGCPGDASCREVTVIYRYKNNPVLPLVSLFDTSWVPDDLRSRATVALKAS